MKIYFACSIRGGRDDAAVYAKLAAHIKTKSNLLTEQFTDTTLTSQGMNKPNEVIWSTDINWIKESDAIIAEVTNPSLGVGYEIAKAEEWGKPVLALYRKKDTGSLSAMIDGSPQTSTIYYSTLPEAKSAIDIFITDINDASNK